jgi:hypothetical protein
MKMKTKTREINPNALYWSSFDRFELRLSGQCVLDCAHSGQCDEDVEYWVPLAKEQAEKDAFIFGPTAERIRAELREYGAWSDEELADDEQNWHRLVWIAANNIRGDDERDCSEPLKISPPRG